MGNFIPENDMQELWELSGRVEAVEVYIKNYAQENYGGCYVDGRLILCMLGRPMEELQQRKTEVNTDFEIEDFTAPVDDPQVQEE